jgi:hypothetical protein
MTQLFKLSGAALTLCALGAITTLPAQAVDPATLIGVGLKAAPHVINGVKSTLPHVFRSRSVIVEVSNQTNLNLRVTANRHKHGGFNSQLLPQDRIPAKHFNVFASGATGVATGTNGSVDYSAPGLGLRVWWSNPYIGSNKCGATLVGPSASQYRITSFCGRGNHGAMMRFTLTSR